MFPKVVLGYPQISLVRPRVRSLVGALAISALIASASACVSAGGHATSGPTQADRLIQVYPELKSGRFAVIADFEDSRHIDLIQLIGVSDSAKSALDRKGGRSETGRRCLSFTVGSPEDTVVVGNRPEGQWYLKRDWRAYDLLLLSIHSPMPGLALRLTIAAGEARHRVSAQSSIRLEKGWNVLRLDLAEIGDLIPLDDVQQIRMSVDGVRQTARLRLDDLVLTGNREELFGDSRNTSGKLYVQRVGRRWNVGAGGRFELTFANGQITHWHNLHSDPNRLRNLVQGTTLGPSPVIVDEGGAPVDDFSALGRSVVARQRLIETGPVRTVIASEWRFVDDPEAPTGGRPFQRWLYTIYPTGQVYVVAEATARTPGWNPPGMGLALAVLGGEGEWSTMIGGSSAELASELPVGAAFLRNTSANAAILWTLAGPSSSARIMERYEADAKRLCLVALDEGSDDVVRQWTCQLFVSALDGLSAAESAARARQYQSPAPLQLEIGSLSPAAQGVPSPASFDMSDGCHVVAPEEGKVRFVIEGQGRPIFSPAFRIAATSGADCWVYVDHLVLAETARSADGELIFQLPRPVTKRTLVEVLSRRSPRTPFP